VHQTPDGPVVVDPTVAVFRSQGEEHRTSHPTTNGDENTEVQFPAGVVDHLLDRRGRFRIHTAPILETISVRHRRLFGRIKAGVVTSPLEIEEEGLSLLRAAYGMKPPTEVPARHRGVVDDTRQFLAARFREDIDLATLAMAVGASPFHLSRIFKRATGSSISEYRTALRIRCAIDRIASGADDLSRVAVEAGFYDHAHMTNTFRRRLGAAPSQLRDWFSG
jgi:AraC-like DNA-binding protein